MDSKVKKLIEEVLNPDILLQETYNRFYDYYDEEDLEEYEEEPIKVILAYEGEEIPLDITQDCLTTLKKELNKRWKKYVNDCS